MNVSAATPTISQMLFAMNNPQPTNFNTGTANAEANAASAATVSEITSSAAGVGTTCGGSIDTMA